MEETKVKCNDNSFRLIVSQNLFAIPDYSGKKRKGYEQCSRYQAKLV